MISRVASVAFEGVETRHIDVQVSITKGLPSFNIVGLADKSVSESKERLRSALISLGIALPAARITVNLSPADLIKEGSHFDLPIALGVLAAMEIIPASLIDNFLAMGELSLSGEIKSVKGLLPAAIFAVENELQLVFPKEQINELFVVKNTIKCLPITNLSDVINHFKGYSISYNLSELVSVEQRAATFIDMSVIKGQQTAKRAIKIAAAGGHNLLMIGVPGSGKTMLANALGGILPPLTSQEILDINLIYSLAGELNNNTIITQRPYRSPHHSSSAVALLGGGSKAKLGEITLAHQGILFLDEIAEFNRNIIDSLRQPLENGSINIARANYHVRYPAKFQLIAAMNPCKCGYFGEAGHCCSKAPLCAEAYQSKISGPMMDRFDIVIEVPSISFGDINSASSSPSSADIAQDVMYARNVQQHRYAKYDFDINSEITPQFIDDLITINPEGNKMLGQIMTKYQLSARGYYRLLRTAQTIADLENAPIINKVHISEAAMYRRINYQDKNSAGIFL